MAEDPFQDLATLFDSASDTVSVGANGITGFLISSARELARIADYLDAAEEPTSVRNLELLRKYFLATGRYLDSFTKSSLRGTIDVTRGTVATALRHTKTLKRMAVRWEARSRDINRPLRDMGSDDDAIFEKQEELKRTLVTLAEQLALVKEDMEEDARLMSHSRPSTRQGQGPPSDSAGDERFHHMWRRRRIS